MTSQPSEISGYVQTAPRAFSSAHGLAMVVIILLMMTCLLTLLVLGSQAMRISHLDDIAPSAADPVDPDPAGAVRHQIIVTIQMVLFALTSVVFLAWVYRTYRNLTMLQLSSRPRFSPEWAVAGFVVPGMNVVFPRDVMAQVWSGSSHSGRETTRVTTLWWVCFVGSWVICLLGMVVHDSGIRGLVQQVWWSIVAQILWLISAIMCIEMVRRIDLMQREKSAMVADLESTTVVPVGAPKHGH